MSSQESKVEVEKQLREAGDKLLHPPSSLDDLLALLDQVENLLARVEQSPSKSTQDALSPSVKALLADELLRHSNIDVKVAVASCISEITRITAPDAPYEDDEMKDVFQLIVSSFENLDDKSSRSYNKRIMILDTVAKVRSCVVMLDLELDGLVNEMFTHFFKVIRDYHPESVFSSMETIMTLVLEESEDISSELLTILLASVKKDNQVLPIAVKLGERVFGKSAVKLKPYLKQAVKSLGISLENYNEIVTSVCEGTAGAKDVKDNESTEQLAGESKSASASPDGNHPPQDDEAKQATASSDVGPEASKGAKEESCPEELNPAISKSPKSIMSNGVSEAGKVGTPTEAESLTKAKEPEMSDQSNDAKVQAKPVSDSSGIEKAVKPESTQELPAKKRGRKPNSSMKSNDSTPVTDRKTQAEEPVQVTERSDVPGLRSDDEAVDTVSHMEKEGTDISHSSPKPSGEEAVNVASSGVGVNTGRSKRTGRAKKKENAVHKQSPSPDVASKKLAEETDSELKPPSDSAKKALDRTANEKSSVEVDTSQQEGDTTDSEATLQNEPDNKAVATGRVQQESLSRKKGDGKKHGHGKAGMEKDTAKSIAKDDNEEMVASPKSPTGSAKDDIQQHQISRSSAKRKRTPAKGKVPELPEYGENLVGRKVKVWWPKDHMFYEGVIDSFDNAKKKHKVLYNDGDEEILNLKRERWEFIQSDTSLDGDEAADSTSSDSSELQKKKKPKPAPESSTKQRKMDITPRSAGGGSMASKSGRKSKDEGKGENVSRVTKSGGKSGGRHDSDVRGKSRDHSHKNGGKPVDDTPRASGKAKDSSENVSKTKSKQETPVATSSKVSGGVRPSSSSSGKLKSSTKEPGKMKDKPADSAKSPDVPKSRESEPKSGKKRGRGSRS